MKRFLGIVICVGLFYMVRGCIACSTSPDPSPDVALTTQGTGPSKPDQPMYPSIRVSDLDGESKELTLGPDVSVLYMATWCPHSKALKKMVQDPAMATYLKGKTLVFIFGTREWSQVKSELQDLVKSGESTQSQADATLTILKQKAHGSKFFDPDFFNDLPGDVYVAEFPKSVTSFPTTRVEDRYRGGTGWMQRELNMPTDTILALYHQYDPPQNDTGENTN